MNLLALTVSVTDSVETISQQAEYNPLKNIILKNIKNPGVVK